MVDSGIVIFKGKEARSFIEKMENPPENKMRDNTIERAKKLNIDFIFEIGED